ncbi:putative fatty acyl-CoA reductase CG5065 [Amblyomma americanum]
MASLPDHQQGPSTTAGPEGKDDSQVAQFYQDRVVFLTGGTGLVGKVLLEKLLRSCPGLKRVYVLIRTKRGEDPQARLATILSSQVFERLKQEQPDAFEKVRAVSGDLTLPNLGLSASDTASLVEEVSVVFHSAATTKFNEPLKLAVQINVLGTRRVLDLCKRIPNLSALVHVSTAYCNCDIRTDLHEVIYEPWVKVEEVINATESADENVTDTPDGLLRGLPNTYTFTKRLAESLVLDERGAIPVAIVRPSIVTASWREPFPGWIDNFAACTGAAASLGLGLLPSIMANKDCIADIIPVDIVANMLICVAWRTANTRPEHVAVYHCTSGDLKRQTWGDLTAALQRSILRHPLPYMVRYPDFAVTSNHMWHNVLWYLHYLPVYVGGVALQLIGRKPRLAPRLEKVRERTAILQYFLTHGWLFKWNNVVGLIEDLSQTDKKASGTCAFCNAFAPEGNSDWLFMLALL